MTREQLIQALSYAASPDLTDIGDAEVWWRIEKSFPHVDVKSSLFESSLDRSVEETADEIIQLEKERYNDPLPPFITHEELIDNVNYLQQRMFDFGERNYNILVPLCLEFRYAQLGEMIWYTHRHHTPEEIVAELYRRQIDGLKSDLPPSSIVLPHRDAM